MKMNVDRPDLLAEAQTYFNEPILSSSTLCRLVGYAEDQDDCYWITKRMNKHDILSNYQWTSCVGGFIPLRLLKEQNIIMPKYPKFDGEVWNDYNRLDNVLELNGATKEAKFIIIKKETTYIDLD